LPPVRSAFLARLCRDSEPNTRIFLAYLAARNAHSTPSSVAAERLTEASRNDGVQQEDRGEAHKNDRERGTNQLSRSDRERPD